MWYRQSEQSAGRWRIWSLWLVYRLFGKRAVQWLLWPVFAFIYPWCKPARAALDRYYRIVGVKPRPFRHLLGFAQQMMDKTDACTLCKNPPRMTVTGDPGWDKGAFLVSTHVGTIEVLPALARKGLAVPHVHAFQQLSHDAVFTSLFLRHLNGRFTLHAVEDIGVETAVAMQEAIRKGDLVLMAGDRLSAGETASLRRDFLGRTCRFPKGVFVFARLMEAPVYAIACVKTGPNDYEVHAKRLSGDLLDGYVRFLEDEVRRHPYQWFQFYDFFE
jgi:predicted LPLAT superfamily acyltransferase